MQPKGYFPICHFDIHHDPCFDFLSYIFFGFVVAAAALRGAAVALRPVANEAADAAETAASK